MNQVAEIYINGNGVERSEGMALSYYLRAAKAGDPIASYKCKNIKISIADSYLNNEHHNPDDLKRAFLLLQQACLLLLV
jgi:TPR repeat protein